MAGEKKCSCGNNHFETVDVTPWGMAERRYFIRCKACGRVTKTYHCSLTKGIFQGWMMRLIGAE